MTVDGLAFDTFSMSMTEAEWDIITENNNYIRLKYSNRFNELTKKEYLEGTSKLKRLKDKKDLTEEVAKDRHALVRIMKLTLGDFSPQLRLKSIPKDISILGTKAAKFSQKDYLSNLKAKVLEQYRKEGSVNSFNVPLAAQQLVL
jgi:hypothetical protein